MSSVGRGLAVVTAETLFAEVDFRWTFVWKQNITSNVRFEVFYIVLAFQSLAGSLSSLQKSEFLKLIILIFHVKLDVRVIACYF